VCSSDLEPSRLLAFEEVVVEIGRTLAARKKEQLLEDLVTELQKKADVNYLPAGAALRD
jgi:hypothetical protein